MINSESLQEVRKQIEKLAKEKKQAIVLGREIEFNRKILEMKKLNMLVIQHKLNKNKLKQRDSGLNEVLCGIARKNSIVLAIDFSEILNSEGKDKARILGGLIQNIKLMKMAGNRIEIINKPEDRKSMQAFLLVLGIDTKLASELCQ